MKVISLRVVYAALASFVLAGCGGGGGDSGGSGGSGSSTYVITATFTGVTTSGLVMVNNGANPVAVPAGTASVTIAAGLATGSAYSVTAQTVPTGFACAPATAGSNVGTIGTTSVTIAFVCGPAFNVGGSISGLTSTGLRIRLFPDFANAANIAGFNVAPAAGASSYQFPFLVRGDLNYIARIVGQPAGRTCAFANNTADITGSMNGAAVSAPVTCTALPFTIGGSVTGQTGNVVVRLNGNSATDQTVAANGSSFTFSGSPVLNGGSYTVAVVTSPAGQICTPQAETSSGTVGTANVTNVAIVCSNITTGFTIGGTITGNTGSVTLLLNNGNGLATSGPSFTFGTTLASAATYAVTIATPPAGQTCALTGGSGNGTVGSANVNTVAVTCTTAGATYTIGGTVTGNTSNVVLRLNGNSAVDQTVTSGGGPFTFPGLATGSPYNVGVFTFPTGQVCTPANAAGTVASSNVTNITVTCANTGSIGGTISGLTGSGLVLQLNGGNDLTVPVSSTIFNFPAGAQTGFIYSTHIKTQPTGQTCTIIRSQGNIAAGAPTIATSNPLAPAIACVNNVTSPLAGTYQISGLDLRALLTFYADGTYIFALHADAAVDPGCIPANGGGLEYGVYNWNQTSHAFAVVTAAIDSTGDCGLADGAAMSTGTLIKNGNGTLSVDLLDKDGSGEHFLTTMTPVPSTGSTLIGSFGDNQGFTAYAGNGTFLTAQTRSLAQANNTFPGIEDGCYQLTGTPSSGSFTVNLTGTCHVSGTQVAIDTTGVPGFSVAGSNPWNFALPSADQLQLAISPATPAGAGGTRIVPN